MFTATLDEFKIKQDEMLRQAQHNRLVRAAKKASTGTPGLIQKITKLVGQLMSL